MADRYFVNGGVDNNWGTTGNWSTTSGGAGGSSVPTSSDAVFLDGNSPNCTLNTSARVCLSLDCTGYTNTLNMGQQLTVSGSVTLASGMTITGSSALIIAATATLTSNGKTWPSQLTINANFTTTLADDWTVAGLLQLGSGIQTATINGFQITAQAGLTIAASSGIVTGTTNIILAGTGTVTGSTSAGPLRNNLTINTAGTITFAASNTFSYNTGTLTYTAGTVVVSSGHVLRCSTSATFDVASITWNDVTFLGSGAVITLSSNLNMSGLLSLGSGTNAVTINGFSINSAGGIRHAGTSGNIGGTTQLVVTGTCTLDGPSVTSGRIDNPIEIDASGGTVTVDALFKIELSQFLLTAGTVVTDAGTWASGGGGGSGGSKGDGTGMFRHINRIG